MAKLLLVLVPVLLIAWWYLRRRGAAAARGPSGADRRISHSAPPSEFHAVSIKFPAFACEAARELEGRRFLATEAPRLPLPGCDRENCECRFQHYGDRRSGRDRRSPFGSSGVAAATGTFEQERRRSEGRRSDD